MANMTSKEKQAIYNISMLVMMIDGHIASQEAEYWRKIGSHLHMNDAEKQSAAGMDKNEAVRILRSMNGANKMIAIKIFTEMVVADGRIDEREKNLLYSLMDTMDYQQAVNDVGGLDAVKKLIDEYGR